jgi:PAS domain S-box-containing protein
MKNDDPEIIKTLRAEERLGRLQSRSMGEPKKPLDQECEHDSFVSMFSILRHHKGEDIPTIDLGDPIEKYRIIFDNSAVAIMLTDENERIVHWNAYTETLLGMNRNELMMKPVKYLYPAEEWKKIRSENIRQKGIQYHLETKMIRKDNLVIDVDISLSVIKDRIENVIGSIGIIKDNSEKKKMEQALRISQEKFKHLYEKAPVAYHTLSPEGMITDVNEKWCHLLGYTKEETIGTSIFEYIQNDEQEIAKASFREKISGKKAYTKGQERTYIRKNGEPRIFMIHDFLSFNESGGVLSIYSTMDDVTERKKIEGELRKAQYWLEKKVQERTVDLSKQNTLLKKRNNEYKRTIGELHVELEKHQKTQKRMEKQNTKLKKLDRAKSNFLHLTSHELRTSISSIKGYAEVLLLNSLGPLNDEQKKGIGVILSNTTRLSLLIQDLLDITHLESGTMKFTPEKTNITKLVKEAIGTSEPAAEIKQITIDTQIPKELPELMIDKNRMKQALINLLQNAIQSSPENSTIKIKINKEPDEVLFEIRDAGQVIPKNKQKQIFDVVYQSNGSNGWLNGDIGLGLTVSRGIVLSHGGKIWVENQEHNGNIMRFTLPNKSIQGIKGKIKDVDIFRL